MINKNKQHQYIKLYTIQVKLSNKKMVTYHAVNNLIRFCNFLDTSFDGLKNDKWLFCNVYDKYSKDLLGNYLNGKNPTRPRTKTEL
jgi:anaerobic ribonucleoside-triphosphate reductase